MKKIIMSLLGCTLCLASAVNASAADTSMAAGSDGAKWNLNGFVDAGWATVAGAGQPTGNNQGFLIRDGAVTLRADYKTSMAFVEIPFGNSLATNADGASPNLNLVVPFAVKGQAFVGQKYDCGLFWKLGQFEKIFGVEGNDTKDLLFTQQGLLYTGFIPRVHTGVLLGDKFADMFEAKIYVAQTTGTLSNDGTAVNGNNVSTTNYDFGATVAAHAGDGNLQLGYRMHKNVFFAANEGLFDVVAGYKFSPININAGFDMANYAAPGSSTGIGFLGQVSDQFTDMCSAGVRFEYVTAPGGISGANAWMLTVGPQYKATEHMTIKADYSYVSGTAGTGATALTGHLIAIDGVFSI